MAVTSSVLLHFCPYYPGLLYGFVVFGQTRP